LFFSEKFANNFKLIYFMQEDSVSYILSKDKYLYNKEWLSTYVYLSTEMPKNFYFGMLVNKIFI